MLTFLIWVVIIAVIVGRRMSKMQNSQEDEANRTYGINKPKDMQRMQRTQRAQRPQKAKQPQKSQKTPRTSNTQKKQAAKPANNRIYESENNTIHSELHGEHIHDEENILCRANIDSEAQEIVDKPSILGTTEDLIACGYDGSEFLREIMGNDYF